MHLSLSIDKDVILSRLAEHRQNHQPMQSVSLIIITLKYDSSRARAVSKALLVWKQGFSTSALLTCGPDYSLF